MEEWKNIKGYEGLYQINKKGQIRSLDRYATIKSGAQRIVKGKMKIASIRKDGYYSLILSKKGINKRYVVHRLLAETFIPNPENKCCVNHIDGNKQNNELSNLEWCSHVENMKHAFKTKLIDNEALIKRGAKISKERRKKVAQFTKDNKLIAVYESQHEAEVATNIPQGRISFCCSGKYKTAGGFIWKFV